MHIAIGCFYQESHSFAPCPGSWEHFGPNEYFTGYEILDRNRGKRTEIGGAIAYAQDIGIELCPLIQARSCASAAPILKNVYESIRDNLIEKIRKIDELDGILLAMHGAMLAEGYEDATGDVLHSIRQEIGDIPLVVTLDLHANVTQLMVDQADAIVGYHTYPHDDQFETGQRGMSILNKIVTKDVEPVSSLRRIPMILPGDNASTQEGPFADVMSQAIEFSKRPDIVDISIFSVQPWLDIIDIGCSVLVVSDDNLTEADKIANYLANEFWNRRSSFAVKNIEPAEAISAALSSVEHPTILADGADAPSSGAPGDSTVVLRELLKVKPNKKCFLNIVDKPAVNEMKRIGFGNQITLKIGARFSPELYDPVHVTGIVSSICDGSFDQIGHDQQKGMTFHRGLTGILEIGHISLVISERAVFQWCPEFYFSVGLDIREAHIVLVKSPLGFRIAYEPYAANIMFLDTPGVASSNLLNFPFKKVKRPLYPLDDFRWKENV